MIKMKAIAAVAENGVIGNGLQIPWHIIEDFKHFKRTTLGGIIVMGRKTWESLGGRPLPNRENVIVTSSPEPVEGAVVVKSLEELSERYANDARQVWICGGAKLYETALDFCDEIILSRVKMRPNGDVFFPKIEDSFEPIEKILENPEFDVIRYMRKRPQ